MRGRNGGMEWDSERAEREKYYTKLVESRPFRGIDFDCILRNVFDIGNNDANANNCKTTSSGYVICDGSHPGHRIVNIFRSKS